MRFGPIPVDDAAGAILGHNVVDADGRRVLRKGKPLEASDLDVLRRLGRSSVYVAVLEPGDVDENRAAERVTRAVVGAGCEMKGPATGRVNVHAAKVGVVRVDVERLVELNRSPGITLATLRDRSAVAASKMVGTTKILPYAVPEEVVARIERQAAERGSLLWVEPLPERRVGLVVSATPASREKIVAGFETALQRRLEQLGSSLARTDFVPLESETGGALEALALVLREQTETGLDLVLLAGETAIQDRDDLAPRAIEAAGGVVECFGAPVDPGNLVLLGRIGETTIVGAPGCARSPKRNIVDLLLPRILVGERLTAADVIVLGHGGLLEDVAERPLPRRKIEASEEPG